jgi:hypothetical protein
VSCKSCIGEVVACSSRRDWNGERVGIQSKRGIEAQPDLAYTNQLHGALRCIHHQTRHRHLLQHASLVCCTAVLLEATDQPPTTEDRRAGDACSLCHSTIRTRATKTWSRTRMASRLRRHQQGSIGMQLTSFVTRFTSRRSHKRSSQQLVGTARSAPTVSWAFFCFFHMDGKPVHVPTILVAMSYVCREPAAFAGTPWHC